MKNLYQQLTRALVGLFACVVSFSSIGQTPTNITVGTNSIDSYDLPMVTNYGYNYTQTVYTATELTVAGVVAGPITKLSYLPKFSTSTALFNHWDVYLSTITANNVSTAFAPVVAANQVFSGALPANTVNGQWMELTFSTPFVWDGTSNIVITVNETTASYEGYYPWAGYSSTISGKSRYSRKDNGPAYVAGSVTGGSASSTSPYIRLEAIMNPCFLQGATVSNTTYTGTTISWPAGSLTEWEVIWGTQGFNPTTGTPIGSQIVNGTPTLTISGLTSNTNYDAYVRPICSGTPGGWSSAGTFHTGYCTTSIVYTGDYSSAFSTTNAISNITYTATANVSNGYSYQSTVPFLAIVGSTVNFSHTYVGGGNGVRIWVDWNNDLVFSPTESVFFLANSSATKTGNFVVPAGTASGTYRMRMRSAYGSSIDPPACGELNYGTTLDYNLVVIAQPVAGAIAQDPTTPTCTAGTILTATGSAPAGEAWYWQTTETGTSTANTGASPWTVFENGTYYLRALNVQHNVWGPAQSITVSNIPIATAPPTPIAGQNPACVPGTTLMVPAATGTNTYYWQGTSNISSDNTMNANTPYNVTATGIYYVKTFDSATNCWSAPVGTSVSVNSFIPMAPVAAQTDYYACSGATTQPITANVLSSGSAVGNGLGVNQGTMYNTSVSNTSVSPCAQTVSVPVPLGATIIGVNVTYAMNSLNNGWISEQRSFLKCISTGGTAEANVTSGTGDNEGTFNYNRTNLNIANGVQSTGMVDFQLHAFRTYGNSSATGCTEDYAFVLPNSLVITVNYTFPPTATNWYDAATGGNLVGITPTMESIGTSVLPVATNGVYPFFAEGNAGGCASTRTQVNVHIADVNVELISLDATCNTGLDGSFAIGNILCGTSPLSFSIDGGAYTPVIPTDLAAGTHQVIVRDGNNNLSGVMNFVVGSPDGPSNVVVNYVTSDEALVSWTPNGQETAWLLEWGPTGFVPGTGAEEGTAVATDTFFLLTNLSGSQTYDVYVSANCGTGTAIGDWSSNNFVTDCSAITAFPFCTSFEDSLACWHTYDLANDQGTAADYINAWSIGNDSQIGVPLAISGSNTMINYHTSYNDVSEDWLVMPHLNLTGNEVLSFNYTNLDASDPTYFRVVMSTTGRNIADFTTTLLASMTSPTTFVMSDTSVVLNHVGKVYIAFVREFNGMYYYPSGIALEDVCVDVCNFTPSQDGSVDACRTGGVVDLNSIITSDYTHGTWTSNVNQTAISGSDLNVSSFGAGTYTFTYTLESACMTDVTLATVNVIETSSAGVNGVITTCKNQPINLMGGLSGTIHAGGTWYDAAGVAIASPYFTTGTLLGQAVYKYVVSNGICAPDTSEVLVNIGNCDWLGLDQSVYDAISVSPNPSTGKFQINGVFTDDFSFEVLDLHGRVVKQHTAITSATTTLDLSNVETGVYMLRVFSNDGDKLIRLIKQ